MLKSKFIFARQSSWGLAMLNRHLEHSWETRCFPSQLAVQKKRTGWIVTARCMLKRQAELQTPNVRASKELCLIMLKCYFKNCSFFQGCTAEKNLKFKSSRQADRTGPDLQFTYLISDGGTAAYTQTQVLLYKLKFYFTNPIQLFKFLDLSLCTVWAFVVFFGTEVQLAGTRNDPKNSHAYALALIFQHCDSAQKQKHSTFLACYQCGSSKS